MRAAAPLNLSCAGRAGLFSGRRAAGLVIRRFLVITSVRKFQELPHVHARILTAALLLSRGVRHDAEAVFYLKDEDKTVRVVGSRVRRLFPDEDSSIGFLRKALTRGGQAGVIVRRGARDLLAGTAIGPGGRKACIPRPPFTYVVRFEDLPLDVNCSAGLEDLPPHHQVVVINVTADRVLRGLDALMPNA